MSHKNISLSIPREQFDEWLRVAKEKGVPLEAFIEDAVEGRIIRKDIIKYLNDRSKHLPWWKKKSYSL